MVRSTKGVLLVAALSVPLAQVGHVLAYGLRIPTGGAHAYFPFLFQTTGAFMGTGLLAALAVLVLARLLSGEVARRKPWSFALLACGLLSGQLAVFMLQETLESHATISTGGLAIGLLAQQPVALAAALALRWLSARVGPALEAVAGARRPMALSAPMPLLTPAPAFVLAPFVPSRSRPIRGQRAPPL
jgi:hypothetical protein